MSSTLLREPDGLAVAALETLYVLRRLKERAAAALREAETPSLERLKVLAALRAGPMRAGELARRSHSTPPAITDLCDGLAADGLVARDRDPADRRVVLHKLTSAGRRELRRAEKLAAMRVADVLGQMAPTAREHFAEGIRAMHDILERMENPS